MAGSENTKPDVSSTDIESGKTTEPKDEAMMTDHFIVGWEEPAERDPENPMNWSMKRKWGIIAILSFISFLTPLASSMMAPAVPSILADLHSSNDSLATFVVSIFVLGFAFGPLILAPLSEIYGRARIYHTTNILFTIFTVACALAPNMEALVAFRFLAGFAGVAVLTCGSGTIVDLMPIDQRGRAMAIWSVGPLLGPVLGPVCAGFLVEAASWRWVFWVIAMASGLVTIASFLILRETYAPEILKRKAARLRKETGDERYTSTSDETKSIRHAFAAAMIRPARMFFSSPVVMLPCVYIAVVYGILYILFTTFTFVYTEYYGFDARGAGLSFIAGGVGNLLALLFTGTLSDRLVRAGKARGRAPKPEDRLNLLITVPAAILLPAGLLIYGWTARADIHWIAPMMGTAVLGFGMMGIFMSVQTYLIDSFPQYAASVTAANSVLRSLLGAVLPLFGLQLYDALGMGWGNTLLAGILLLLAPVPWVFAVFGHRIRESPRWRKEF